MSSIDLPCSPQEIVNGLESSPLNDKPEEFSKSPEELQKEALDRYNKTRKKDEKDGVFPKRKIWQKKPNLPACDDIKYSTSEKWRFCKSMTSGLIEIFRRSPHSETVMNDATEDERTVSTVFSSESSNSFCKPSNRSKGCWDSFKEKVTNLKPHFNRMSLS